MMKFRTKKADAEAPTKDKNNDNKKKKLTQEEIVLAHMQRFGKRGITSMEAFSKYHITRLSSAIFKLRRSGHSIITIRETDKNGNSYGRYVLREVNKDERV